MATFYVARSEIITPLPWLTFALPFSIWRIWRQVEEPASGLPKRVCRRDIPVGCKVVQYDDGAGRQDRHQNLFDIRGEGGTVHRALDDPRCYQPVRRQACNERLRAPVAKGGVHLKPLAARGAAPQPGEVCLHRGLVNEHKPLWLQSHGRHAARQPIVPRLPYPGAAALGGHSARLDQIFIERVERNRQHTEERAS